MADIVLRSVKGSPLTNNEVDTNFSNLNTELSGKQNTLVSGTNIKTVRGQSLLGSGNIAVGSVNSVGISLPTGLEVAGSPITESGTFAVTYSTGYSIPSNTKQSNWDTAYGWGNHASAGYAAASHSHSISNITSLQTTLNAKANLSGATFTGAVGISNVLNISASSSSTARLKISSGVAPTVPVNGDVWFESNHMYARVGGVTVDLGRASITNNVNTLSTSGTITLDFSSVSPDFTITLTGNGTLANPSNMIIGRSGVILIKKSVSRTLSFGSYWKFAGGAPSLNAGAATDVIPYFVSSPTEIVCSFVGDIKS